MRSTWSRVANDGKFIPIRQALQEFSGDISVVQKQLAEIQKKSLVPQSGPSLPSPVGPVGLPSLGTANQVLGVNAAATLHEYKTLTGTTNQVSLAHGVGTVTFSLPQDIHTAASPTFAGLTLSGTTATRLLSTDGSKLLVSTSLNSWVTGTANRVTVADDGDGTITLSGPQDLHTAASPTFAALTLSSPLTIPNGGTGQTTAPAAFNALSPLTTQGDILYRNAATNTRLAPGTAGQVLQSGGAGANPSWVTAGAGTVTSVALSLPAELTVTGSPVTTSGTLGATWASQSAGYIFAAPAAAPGVPTFRAIAVTDIPTLNQNTTGTAANVTGIVALANGGAGANISSVGANTVFAGMDGMVGAPSFRTLAASDIPNLAASKITTGVFAAARGGTGVATFGGVHRILYTSAADVLTSLAGNDTSTRKFLRQVDDGMMNPTAPAWDTVTKTDVGLSSVENTALSTWAGSTAITTLGTITLGLTAGNPGVASPYLNSADSWRFNIDSNNDGSTAYYEWGANTTANSGGTVLARLTEGGNYLLGTTTDVGPRQVIEGTGFSSVTDTTGTAGLLIRPSAQNLSPKIILQTLNAGSYGYAGMMVVNLVNYDSNLDFFTNPAGSSTPAVRLRIGSDGAANFQGNTISSGAITSSGAISGTTGTFAAAAAATALSVTGTGVTGISVVRSGTGANNYAIDAEATGAGTNNFGGYFVAANATNNYAIYIPNGYPPAGANNYAIRSASTAQSHFSGPVEVTGLTSTTGTFSGQVVGPSGKFGVNNQYAMYTTNAASAVKPWFASAGNDTVFYNTNASGNFTWRNAADADPTIMALTNAGDLLLGTTTAPSAGSGKVMAFGDNGGTDPTMGASTVGIWDNGGTLKTSSRGVAQSISGVIFSQTADVTVANTATETTLVGSGVGTATLPASSLIVGRVIRVKATGEISSLIAAGFTLRLKLGSTTLSNSIITFDPAVGGPFIFEGLITCRSTGASGTVVAEHLLVADLGGTYIDPRQSGGPVTIDTTASQAVSISADWDSASASNTITCRQITIELLN